MFLGVAYREEGRLASWGGGKLVGNLKDVKPSSIRRFPTRSTVTFQKLSSSVNCVKYHQKADPTHNPLSTRYLRLLEATSLLCVYKQLLFHQDTTRLSCYISDMFRIICSSPYSLEFHDLIHYMMQVEPSDRPFVEDIITRLSLAKT